MTKEDLQIAKNDLKDYQDYAKHLKRFKALIQQRPNNERLIEEALDYISDSTLDLYYGKCGLDVLDDHQICTPSDCANEHLDMADMEDGDDRKTDLQEAKECKQASNEYCDDPNRLDADTPVTAKEALNIINDALDQTPKTLTEADTLEPDYDRDLGAD